MGKPGGRFLIESIDLESLSTPEDFTDEQVMIAHMTEDFVKEQVWPVLGQIEAQQFEHTVRLLKQAGELGLLGADVPETYGGVGLDKVSSTLITEKIADARSFALSHGAHVGIGTLPIVFFGTESQKKKYLPVLATGQKIAAYALTEPSSGSDALSVKTTATLSKDGQFYLLNGEKQWITNSGFANLFIVYAKIDGKQFSAFIVERDFPGVSTGPEEKKMGIHGSSTRTLLLDQAKVPVENLLGEIGKGHRIAFNILNMGRFKLAAGTVGSAKRAIELSTVYAKERKQFGQSIAQFALIKEKLAQMAIQTYALESVVYRIAGLLEDGLKQVELQDGKTVANKIRDFAIECSIAKVFGSEVLDYVVDEGVQIHGGYGYMSEYEIENLYRDARIHRIFEGTNEINRLLIPATLVRTALKGELPLLQMASKLQEELLSYLPPIVEETGILESEQRWIENAKKLLLMIAGIALKKYEETFADQQEIVRDLADLIIEIFVMESTFARTKKDWHRRGEDRASLKIDYTKIFHIQAIRRIERVATHALSAMSEGDELKIQLAIFRKLLRQHPINEVAIQRRIADQIISAEKFTT